MAACRFDTAARPLPVLSAVITAFVVIGGCGREADVRPGDVRSYRIPRPKEPATVASRDPAGAAAESRPLRYEVPEGWSDGGGSGLRLATMLIGDLGDKNEVTVIPASGTLESNVARWVGQLDETADDDSRNQIAAEAIAAGQVVDVDGAAATIVLLLDKPAREGGSVGSAILGAMIPVDAASALFVKFKGPVEIAQRERENFVRFVSSIRWK